MNTTSHTVKIETALAVRIAAFLRSTKNFVPADMFGCENQSVADMPSIGILYKRNISRQYLTLFRFVRSFTSKPFLGCLYIRPVSGIRDVSENAWIFHAYGSEYRHEVSDLMQALMKEFHVQIKVLIVDENTRYSSMAGQL